jgi:hypothetical protein
MSLANKEAEKDNRIIYTYSQNLIQIKTTREKRKRKIQVISLQTRMSLIILMFAF